MRVLVTGAGGFVGPYLIDALRARGHEPHGMVRGEPGARLLATGAAVHRADVLAPEALRAVMATVRPEGVAHLAGISFVPDATRDPTTAYRVNLSGTLALLDAVHAAAPTARFLFVSSGDVYGNVMPAELPLREDSPVRPVSVYAATKAAAEIAVGQWSRAQQMDIVIARPFNHTGPGQSPSFVCSALAKQVALIERGEQPAVLRVGDMNPIRDFSDVRDIAAGYVGLLERGRRDEVYNLCSGAGTSVADVIAILRGVARLPLAVRRDPALYRPTEVLRIVGSAEKAQAEIGWRPERAIESTLADLVNAWRATP